ncbi:MAG: molybdopterin-dependent oxidoreductase, partial [Rhodospirillaceae bacterium]|nr:molybdopterin-dependent oxidoreductase [Rhodospirillaceae bacterium]
MTQNTLDRRNFLKALGLGGAGVALAGCDLPSYVTLEEGEENVVSYLAPDEYVIPGVGVWYASTCLGCSAGCGIHGRVREGRVLKLEGNPDNTINKGRLCQMGQAALQSHFNPDRIADPLIRKDGKLVKASWDEALSLISSKSKSGKSAWVSGTISGHQRVMVETHLSALNSSTHYAIEQINANVWQTACRDIIGDPNPELKFDKARSVFSLGADFMGTFISPVHFAAGYGEFRTPPRGVLIQAEPAMSLSGANADHWVGLKPGSEAALALGVAGVLIAKHGASTAGISGKMKSLIQEYNAATVERISGVSASKVEKIAATLTSNSPSIVLAGSTATAGVNGYSAAGVALVLNQILGNIGKTIVAGRELAYPQLGAREGNSRELNDFAKDASAGKIDVLFVSGVNPLFLAPK